MNIADELKQRLTADDMLTLMAAVENTIGTLIDSDLKASLQRSFKVLKKLHIEKTIEEETTQN